MVKTALNHRHKRVNHWLADERPARRVGWRLALTLVLTMALALTLALALALTLVRWMPSMSW